MLYLMRKHATSWLIKVILAVIVVVFILWGSEAYRAKQGSRVAAVNGETIGMEEYRSTYERLVAQYRQQFGGSLDSKMLETLNLKQQAMDRIIERHLLLQKAQALDLMVTDEEIIRSIRGMAVFQQDGRFNNMLYQRLLNANRMTPELFEMSLRQDLLAQKMQGIVSAGAKVSDSEAYETYAWREGQVSVDYVLVETDSQNDVDMTAEEVKGYFEEHRSDYEIPPQIKAGYVAFAFKDFESEVEVTDEEIAQYFDLNRASYDVPKKVRARHILFKVDSDASEEKRSEVLATARKVLADARGGSDFATLAKQYSEDPGSKENGGDLGFFTRDRMVKPFADAAFALTPGTISEPVSTVFGWHIIKVEAIQEGTVAVLENVKGDISKKLAQDGAKHLAYEKAESLYNATYSGAQLGEAAKAAGLELVETEFFSKGDRLKDIPQSEKLTQAAFTWNDDEASEPLELGDGYYVAQVIERKDVTVPALEAVEEAVRKDLLKKKKNDLARKEAEGILAAVTGGKAFEEEAKVRGIEVKSTPPFKRFGSIPGIGFEQQVSEVAFTLGSNRPLPDKVVEGKKGYYVLRFKSQKKADKEAFEEQKAGIKTGLLAQKRQKLLEDWLSQLRKEGDIEIEERYLN